MESAFSFEQEVEKFRGNLLNFKTKDCCLGDHDRRQLIYEISNVGNVQLIFLSFS